ncbi:complexed with Cdc5 protein Cwf11 [Schizosaccharomyces japonicus yFS275]|uniref:Complexed with Cdc5 protein Cwf11 n=1 Tax=Schizosaccharomyces japonicus (strain yFS275 / FY16936) TaxID=402676 RepID=B6K104_SCHJY|nr:complexed with Cdc5 protein Cwf11 [Schizosaccharomyces japonicus yFS275]EEB07625.2 complexed with Cdc5 protein Cwf11 [Schizosaccharomyces japonicus yFS275]
MTTNALKQYRRTIHALSSSNWKITQEGRCNENVLRSIADELKKNDLAETYIKTLSTYKFLETCLWPNLQQDATALHVGLTALCLCYKTREANNTFWEGIDADKFSILFQNALILSLKTEDYWSVVCLQFLNLCFLSVDVALIRRAVIKVVGVGTWETVSSVPKILELVKEYPAYQKAYLNYQKKKKAGEAEDKENVFAPFKWLSLLLSKAMQLSQLSSFSKSVAAYLQSVVQLLNSLMSQYPTRRFTHFVIGESNIISVLSLSSLFETSESFRFLLNRLKNLFQFPFDNSRGIALSEAECINKANQGHKSFQLLLFQKFRNIVHDECLATSRQLQDTSFLRNLLGKFSVTQLKDLCSDLSITMYGLEFIPEHKVRKFIENLVAFHLQRFNGADIEKHNELDLESLLNNDLYSQISMWSVCKPWPCWALAIQYLTPSAFCMQMGELSRLALHYTVRKETVEMLQRVQPKFDSLKRRFVFSKQNSRVVPLRTSKLVKVYPPKVGKTYPQFVKLRLMISNTKDKMFDSASLQKLYRKPLYLLNFEKPNTQLVNSALSSDINLMLKSGIKNSVYCHLEDILDENENSLINLESVTIPSTILVDVLCDPFFSMKLQNTSDIKRQYASFNLLFFFSDKVFELREYYTMFANQLSKSFLPQWLEDVFLGFGDPAAATSVAFSFQSLRLQNVLKPEHLPLFQIPSDNETLPNDVLLSAKYSNDSITGGILPIKTDTTLKVFQKASFNVPSFTTSQLHAFLQAVQPGLTLISGPSCSGKTTIAVKLVETLSKNYGNERVLVISPFMDKLEYFFSLLKSSAIPERYLYLFSESLTSAAGLHFLFDQKNNALELIAALAKSLNLTEAHAASCENAQHFNEAYVRPMWNSYKEGEVETFPFITFLKEKLGNEADRLLKSSSTLADHFYEYIQELFLTVGELRPCELIQSATPIQDYIVSKQARVLGITCKDLVLQSGHLESIQANFNTVVMLDSESISEECACCLLRTFGASSVKRLVSFGDPYQDNFDEQISVFRQASNFGRSLFKRLIRSSVPTLRLSTQWGVRESISALYRWQYSVESQNEKVSTDLIMPSLTHANTGFSCTCQFVDVPHFNGVGESEPVRGFKQNLGEAEYAIAIYQYMRMLGYPKEKIAILTLFDGQKALLSDIVKARCDQNSFFGSPLILDNVTTYGGRAVDFLILSMVSTKHIPDEWCLSQLTKAFSSLSWASSNLSTMKDVALSSPAKLLLTAGKVYPDAYSLEEKTETFEMEDVVHLSRFVSDMTKKALEVSKA